MNDKELLELAAKAAGIFMRKKDWPYSDPFDPECLETSFDPEYLSITGTRLWFGSAGEIGGTEEYTWNPLTDDGDALRLAVKLGLLIRTPHHDIGDYSTRPLVCSQDRKKGVSCNEGEEVIDDPYAATRRAIVRAAAEIGKAST